MLKEKQHCDLLDYPGGGAHAAVYTEDVGTSQSSLHRR